MSRVHEGYSDKEILDIPSGITNATVCSRSGKLPIPGLCDATHSTEYFADGTVPTEYCDVHYTGAVCAYENLPASDACPFKVEGVVELPLPEAPAVAKGSAAIQPDGSVAVVEQIGIVGEDGVRRCSHIDPFADYGDPNFVNTINQEQMQVQFADEAAQATADAAAGPQED